MKNKIKKIICAASAVALIVIGTLLLQQVLRPIYIDNAQASVEAFHDLPDDSADVIVYGSSHSWRGINTLKMFNEYGINAYNYSCMWQRINTTDLFVNDSYLTQSPKIAVIDMGNVDAVLKDTDLVGELYYTRGLKNTDTKKEYLNTCLGSDIGRRATYLLPISMFHGNWEDVEEQNFSNIRAARENFLRDRGYFGFDNSVPVEMADQSEFWQEELTDESRKYLDDMLDVCSKNGTRVILVTLPYCSGEFMYRDALKKYAQEKGCEYIDFFELADEIGLDGQTDFSDTDHLNNSGADKITDYLSEYILKTE